MRFYALNVHTIAHGRAIFLGNAQVAWRTISTAGLRLPRASSTGKDARAATLRLLGPEVTDEKIAFILHYCSSANYLGSST